VRITWPVAFCPGVNNCCPVFLSDTVLLRKGSRLVKVSMICRCTWDIDHRFSGIWLCGWTAVVFSTSYHLQLCPVSSPRHLRRGSGARWGSLLGRYRSLYQTVTTSSSFLRTVLHDILLDVLHAARLPSLHHHASGRCSLQRLSLWNH